MFGGTITPALGQLEQIITETVGGGLANITALKAVATAGLSAYTVIAVQSVGDTYELVKGAGFTADNITVVNATDNAANQWVRQLRPSPRWVRTAAWIIDPSASDDEGASTLKTLAELDRRWGVRRTLLQDTTVTIVSSPGASDPFICDVVIGESKMLTFQGTVTTVYSTGVVTTLTQAQDPTTDKPLVFQDTGTSATWTAWINNKIKWKTVGGVAVVGPTASWVTRDLGSQTVRVGTAQRISMGASNTITFTDSSTSVAAGDTYDVVTLPTVIQGRVIINGVSLAATKASTVQFVDILWGDGATVNTRCTFTGVNETVVCAINACQFANRSTVLGGTNVSINNCSTLAALTTLIWLSSAASVNGGWFAKAGSVFPGGLVQPGAGISLITFQNNAMFGSPLTVTAGAIARFSGTVHCGVSGTAIVVAAQGRAIFTARTWNDAANANSDYGLAILTGGTGFASSQTAADLLQVVGTIGNYRIGSSAISAPLALSTLDPVTGLVTSINQTWANFKADRPAGFNRQIISFDGASLVTQQNYTAVTSTTSGTNTVVLAANAALTFVAGDRIKITGTSGGVGDATVTVLSRTNATTFVTNEALVTSTGGLATY